MAIAIIRPGRVELVDNHFNNNPDPSVANEDYPPPFRNETTHTELAGLATHLLLCIIVGPLVALALLATGVAIWMSLR
jgi:hypothetical protein